MLTLSATANADTTPTPYSRRREVLPRFERGNPLRYAKVTIGW
jgi:hypothetical protein